MLNHKSILIFLLSIVFLGKGQADLPVCGEQIRIHSTRAEEVYNILKVTEHEKYEDSYCANSGIGIILKEVSNLECSKTVEMSSKRPESYVCNVEVKSSDFKTLYELLPVIEIPACRGLNCPNSITTTIKATAKLICSKTSNLLDPTSLSSFRCEVKFLF